MLISVKALLGKFKFYHDTTIGKSEHCTCPGNIRERNCLYKGCQRRFRPDCHCELFCSLACFLASGVLSLCLLIEKYKDEPKKLTKKISKTIYRHSPQGQATRSRESENYRNKQKLVQTAAAIVTPSPIIPEPLAELEISEQEIQVLSEAESEVETEANEEAPEEIIEIDLKCRRPGCCQILRARLFLESGKRFCTDSCRDAVRNIWSILRKAYEVSKCPEVFLAICLLRIL